MEESKILSSRSNNVPRHVSRRVEGGRISQTQFNFQVPANGEAQAFVRGAHGHESWRSKILHFLHNHKVQYTLMALLFLDVIILFIETFLVGHYPPCKLVERDCLACCPATSVDGNANDRFLSGGAEDGTSVCDNVGRASCDPNKWHDVHTVEMVLFGFTIAILSIFLVEINLEMVALGPSAFFRQLWYSLDYVIIVVSLTLELVFHFGHDTLGLASATGLVIFARVWRFVRISHGIIEVTTEVTHQRYDKLLEYAEALEAEMKKKGLPLPAQPKSLRRSREEGSA